MRRARARSRAMTSEASLRVYGPNSAMGSEVMSAVIELAKEDCAYHKAHPCRITSLVETDDSRHPILESTVKLSCMSECGSIVNSACSNAEQFIREIFEGQPVEVSKRD